MSASGVPEVPKACEEAAVPWVIDYRQNIGSEQAHQYARNALAAALAVRDENGERVLYTRYELEQVGWQHPADDDPEFYDCMVHRHDDHSHVEQELCVPVFRLRGENE